MESASLEKVVGGAFGISPVLSKDLLEKYKCKERLFFLRSEKPRVVRKGNRKRKNLDENEHGEMSGEDGE